MEFMIAKRDIVGDDDDDYYEDSDGSWWYGPNAAIIKWSIVGVIFLIALLWFFGGYMHAQRRMKKGLQPLAYHRWLLRRSQRNQFQSQNQVLYIQQNRYDEGYQMQGYPAPPPAYNPSFAPPPTYQPPAEFSKGHSNQDWVVPPPGPPPLSESSIAGQQTSLSQTREAQEIAPGTNAEEFPGPSFQPHKQSFMGRFNLFRRK